MYFMSINSVPLFKAMIMKTASTLFASLPYIFAAHSTMSLRRECTLIIIVVVVVWRGIYSKSDTNRTGAEGLSFYYPRVLHCRDQMLAVMLLSQHQVSSSKTVRPRALCGARCIGHVVRTWSAVCSEVPHSQFDERARPIFAMGVWNRPTPVRRRLCLTQAARGKTIPTSLAPVPGTKARSLEALSQYSVFHL